MASRARGAQLDVVEAGPLRPASRVLMRVAGSRVLIVSYRDQGNTQRACRLDPPPPRAPAAAPPRAPAARRPAPLRRP
jgi:hypothetical protein